MLHTIAQHCWWVRIVPSIESYGGRGVFVVGCVKDYMSPSRLLRGLDRWPVINQRDPVV